MAQQAHPPDGRGATGPAGLSVFWLGCSLAVVALIFKTAADGVLMPPDASARAEMMGEHQTETVVVVVVVVVVPVTRPAGFGTYRLVCRDDRAMPIIPDLASDWVVRVLVGGLLLGSAGLLAAPATDQASNLIDQTGAMLVLRRGEQAKRAALT